MRILLTVLIIMILPQYANAQKFNPAQIQPQIMNPMSPFMDDRPKLPQLETVKPISLNNVEKAKAKLAREEQKLIKLAEKAWKKELDLRAKKENLKQIENEQDKVNDPDHQQKIQELKKQIAHSQQEVDKANAEVELRSKIVSDYEIAIEESKFIRNGS